MLHSEHGERYLDQEEFERYCEELGVSLQKSDNIAGTHREGDLERFERLGLLLPALRKVVPGEFSAALMQQIRDNTDERVFDDPKWADMRPLEEVPYIEPEDMTDDDLWHYLDREIERGNRHLAKPNGQDFQPWGPHPPHPAYGPTTYEDSTVRYYHYWQAYQAYSIQKHYPLFADYPYVLERATGRAESDRERATFRRQVPTPDSRWLQLARTNSLFEPLSLYIWLRTNEAQRSYAKGDTGEGYQTLSGQDLRDYDARVAQHARTVQQRYGLTEAQLVEFMVNVINFYNDVKEDERAKLASEIEQDLWYLREFTLHATGKTADELAEEIGKQGGHWVKKTFRYLDKGVEVTEEAIADLELSIKDYYTAFPAQQITDAEVRNLVSFLNDNGLFIVPYSVWEGGEIVGEERHFYELRRYVGMKNLSTGLEDFLRILYNLGINSPNPPTILPGGPMLLRAIIGALFPWRADFDREAARIESVTKTLGLDPVGEAIQNIHAAHTDTGLDKLPHLRVFLIAYWARNLTSHRHPFTHTLSHRLLYGHVGNHIIGAIFDALFYSWTYATQQGWV